MIHRLLALFLGLLFLLLPVLSHARSSSSSSGSGSSGIAADDFLVTGLEEIDPAFGEFDGTMHAGLISITPDIHEDKGKLMFWLFTPHQPKVDDSLVIWFNG